MSNLKPILINSYNGGISNDIFLGQEGSIYDISGLDFRKYSRKLILGPSSDTTTIGPFSSLGDIVAILGTFPTYYLATNLGYIHNWDYKTGETSIKNMVSFIITGGVGTTDTVVITRTKVSRINLTSTTIKSIDFATLSTPTYSDYSDKYRPIVQLFDQLLIGRGNKVDSLDNLGVLTNAVLVLNSDEEIVSMFTIGDKVVIFTDKRQYVWSGIATDSPYSVIPWFNLKIQNAVLIGTKVYVVCSDADNKYLYLTDGFSRDRQMLIRGTDSRIDFQSLGTNQIETNSSIIYIPSSSSDKGIYSFGDFYPGFPQGLGREIVYLGSEAEALYYDMEGGKLIIGHRKTISSTLNTVYTTVDLVGSTTNTGYVEFLPILASAFSQRKQSIKLQFGYDLKNANNNIKIYYRTNTSASYTLWKTISDINKNKFVELLSKDWHLIQFKIEMNFISGSSPEIYDGILVSNLIQNEIE